jgi:tetratricopeptide (TPR) repeat protein
MLLKKSRQVANLPSDSIVEERSAVSGSVGFSGGLSRKIKSIKFDGAKHLSLTVLEKMTSKSRIMFLKLEALFAGWSNNIRSKRQSRTQANVSSQTGKGSEIAKGNDIIKKLQEYKLSQRDKSNQLNRREEEIVIQSEKLVAAEEVKTGSNEQIKIISAKRTALNEERVAKPIISDNVTVPRRRTEIKDRLEELLIERIAVNPKDIEAYERLGEYYMEIKSYIDAKECFKQVIKLNPSDRNAKYRMKRLENILART